MTVIREDVGNARNMDQKAEIHMRAPPREEAGMTATVLSPALAAISASENLVASNLYLNVSEFTHPSLENLKEVK